MADPNVPFVDLQNMIAELVAVSHATRTDLAAIQQEQTQIRAQLAANVRPAEEGTVQQNVQPVGNPTLPEVVGGFNPPVPANAGARPVIPPIGPLPHHRAESLWEVEPEVVLSQLMI
jgi:hypothetical protein